MLQSSFAEVVGLIRDARHKALRHVNASMVDLYWRIGMFISGKVENEAWGQSVIEKLSTHIQRVEPGLRGFSSQNLWRMRQFYEAYRDTPILSTLLRELPWSANLHILSKCASTEERGFYLRLAAREHWSVRELERQIDGCLFERKIKSPAKISTALSKTHPKAGKVFKDSYTLDFLALAEGHSEGDLQKGLVASLRRFLVELGRDFCFVGEEFPLQVGKKDYFIDLLFYHRELRCLVAFELKAHEFKPEYLGKLSFYLESLDRDVRKPHEKPSVGILLCKSKDSTVVEYALSRTLSPSLVAEYRTLLPDRKALQRRLADL